jgi:murein L,D-transpeptidase YcbB/YkuD
MNLSAQGAPLQQTRVFILSLLALLAAAATPAFAQNMAFKQAVAEAASSDDALSAFYRQNGYDTLWTGSDDAERREALFTALAGASEHGLPVARYEAQQLKSRFMAVATERDRGLAEVAASRIFLRYAQDVQTGFLDPKSVAPGIVRKVERRDPLKVITEFADANPRAFIRKLPPQNPEYARLLKEKRLLDEAQLRGGWGERVSAKILKVGDSGPEVLKLRDRLIRMGYMPRTAATGFDEGLREALVTFQRNHGLVDDGVFGPSTSSVLNVSPEERMKQVLVGLERRRWLNQPLGERHIMVNLTNFQAQIIDNNQVTFETRAVIGKNTSDRQTPEFSDVMTHMVINPTWNVPRSIATKEYLPQLQRNRYAVGHLNIVDVRGRVVDRSRVDFRQFNAKNFPFDIKQPPSPRNALGRVKFMFPNKYAIYLHDTPAKSLFARNRRDFSHGCVRLSEPFEFAYALLAPQRSDEVDYFQSILRTGRETRVNLEQPVPVHLVYRTVWVPAKGRANYRDDIYGRDARIFDALVKAGVALRPVQS